MAIQSLQGRRIMFAARTLETISRDYYACLECLQTANRLHEMATGDLMVFELLCYLMNKYGNTPNDSLKSIILSFYRPTHR